MKGGRGAEIKQHPLFSPPFRNLQSWHKLLGTPRMNSGASRYVLLLTQVPKFSIPPCPLATLKESTPIHCVFAESKINIELGEGGSEINLLKMFPKIAKCPNNFGQDCRWKTHALQAGLTFSDCKYL